MYSKVNAPVFIGNYLDPRKSPYLNYFNQIKRPSSNKGCKSHEKIDKGAKYLTKPQISPFKIMKQHANLLIEQLRRYSNFYILLDLSCSQRHGSLDSTSRSVSLYSTIDVLYKGKATHESNETQHHQKCICHYTSVSKIK